MTGYALILEHELGRAAQYARLVEAAHVNATVARSPDEGLFHVQRLGPPSIVVLELSQPVDGAVAFLRNLRALVPARTAPAVIIVDTRQTHELVVRQMIELNVAVLLSRTHTLQAVDRAIRTTLGLPLPPPPPLPPKHPAQMNAKPPPPFTGRTTPPSVAKMAPAVAEPPASPPPPPATHAAPPRSASASAPGVPRSASASAPGVARSASASSPGVARSASASAPGVPRSAAATSPGAPRPPPTARPDHADALQQAERLAEHPLVEKLSKLRVFEQGTTDDYLQRLAADTAEAFGAPRALVWVDRLGRTAFGAHPRPPVDATLRDGGGHWAALRNALAGAPLHVADAALHRLLSRNALVVDGTVRSFAGAPLLGPDGKPAGAICLVGPQPGSVAPGLLDPLVFWAHRVATELRPLHAEPPPAVVDQPQPAPPPPPPAPPGIAQGSPLAFRSVLAALDAGVALTDENGIVAYTNPQLAQLLGLGMTTLAGLRRADFIQLLAALTDAADPSLQTLAAVEGTLDQRKITFSIKTPERRTLRWQTRPIGDGRGRVDEVTDLTREAEATAELAKLVRIDALTELANRHGGEEALGREISQALRSASPLSVGLFEVDGLARLAPPLADSVLRAVAWVLRDTLRGYDLAVRFGPHRLLAILPGVNAAQMLAFADRFRGQVERVASEGQRLATVSGGIAEFDPAHDVERLLAVAEAALNEALRQGGNAVI